MRSSLLSTLTRTLIIGGLALLLAGCNALRLGYGNGPQLAWWWLDGYVDFSSEHAPQVKRGIEQWFAWHRTTQLPEYAALLASAAAEVGAPSNPAAACRWQALIVERLDPAVDRALVLAAELTPGLGEPQFRHLEQRYAKSNAERRAEFLQPKPSDRLKASVERAVDRIESVYGRLDDAQRRVIAAGLAVSPFDAEAWLADTERRQRDILQTFRQLAAERPDADTRLATLRALAERFESPPSEVYRAYQQRLRDFNCAFAAQIHNSTTLAQRQVARDKLKGWEADVRSLVGAAP